MPLPVCDIGGLANIGEFFFLISIDPALLYVIMVLGIYVRYQ